MADAPVPVEQVPVVAAEVPVVAAPVVEAAPAVETAPVVAPEAPAPVAEVPTTPSPAEAPPQGPKDLLKEASAEDKPVEPPADKPVDAKPEEKPVDAPAETPPAEAPPAEPQRLEPFAEYKYELPEDLTLTDERKTQFHSAIEDARNGNPQALVNLHREAMLEHHAAMQQHQRDSWNTTLEGWQQQVEADPDIGGTKFGAVSRRVAVMRDMHISKHERGTPAWQSDMDSFNHMLDSTGVGNHPAMWKFLNNLAERLGEPAHPAVVDPKPAPQGKRGMDAMYDNPRSPRPNGQLT
jgi:hypothetical protein